MEHRALLQQLLRLRSIQAAPEYLCFRHRCYSSLAAVSLAPPPFRISTTSCKTSSQLLNFPLNLISNTNSFSTATNKGEEENECGVEWEEEEETEPVIGDGGDGGGVVLGGVAWGERALAAASEILDQFGDEMEMFAFKVSPRGYIYVRLDKLTNKYGCPSMDEIESFNSLYKKRLDEIAVSGEIPDDLALEVSSPGAERLLKVPDDLDRFKNMPMWVNYVQPDDVPKHFQQKEGVLMLELIEDDSQYCVWKLANVKENRAELGKGRPLSRKMKDWRLKLSFEAIMRVRLYLGSS